MSWKNRLLTELKKKIGGFYLKNCGFSTYFCCNDNEDFVILLKIDMINHISRVSSTSFLLQIFHAKIFSRQLSIFFEEKVYFKNIFASKFFLYIAKMINK